MNDQASLKPDALQSAGEFSNCIYSGIYS